VHGPDRRAACIAPPHHQALLSQEREKRAADRAGRVRAERELAAARLELAAAQAAAAAAAGGGAHMQQVSGTAAVFPLVPIGTLRSCFDSRCVDDARWMIHHPTSPPPLLRPSITHSHAPSINHLSTPLEQHTHTHTHVPTLTAHAARERPASRTLCQQHGRSCGWDQACLLPVWMVSLSLVMYGSFTAFMPTPTWPSCWQPALRGGLACASRHEWGCHAWAAQSAACWQPAARIDQCR
jgi:hypothetical protein